MADQADQILVKSHVARDLLQTAALFNTDRKVVWEYVSNSLQYTDPGRNPEVRVRLDNKAKRITVADNGRGMDWAGLENFFVMHGENLDRRKGRPGRGFFGTGKAAAFGIAEVLRITSVRDGKRSGVQLRKAEIESMESGDPVPVTTLERDKATDEGNGTLVEIEGVHLRSLDQAGIVQYTERQLARYPSAFVCINNHECEFVEPPVAFARTFSPAGDLAEILGDAQLVVKVAKAPLEEELRGIAVTANGVLHETTLAGSEAKEMSQYIFGRIDIPRLDEAWPIPAFDMSRSMQLNPSNELVRAAYTFIGRCVEEVRRELVEQDKLRRASEEAARLAKQASDIARLINDDFAAFRAKLARVKGRAFGGSDTIGEPNPDGPRDALQPGDKVPAEIVAERGGPGPGRGTAGNSDESSDLGPILAPGPPEAERLGEWAGGPETRQRPRGGFWVDFRNLGAESHRARYLPDERTILINLDHPQIAAARGLGSTDELAFRRLAYEVAFSEYAIALASDLAAQDEYLDSSEAIVDIRETVNRVARLSASLYAR